MSSSDDAPASKGARLACAVFLLLASAAGVAPPLLARSPADGSSTGSTPAALRLKAFSAGVMLALAVLHVIADSFARLAASSGAVSLAGCAVLGGFLFSFFADRLALDALEGAARGSKGSGGCGSDDEGRPGHSFGHSHGALLLAHPAARKLATAHLLEASVLVHSVIIGADLGASPAPRSEALAFAGVLAVHQLFEGAALGAVVADTGTSARRKVMLAAAFCLTTPLGVLLGVALAATAEDEAAGARREHLAGLLDGVTGGMLLHITHGLLGEEFGRSDLVDRPRLRAEMYALVLAGVGTMALLARWA